MDMGIIPMLADSLLNDTYEIRHEACWAIGNATTLGKSVTYGEKRIFIH